MIGSFRDTRLEAFWNLQSVKGFGHDAAKAIRRKLVMLEAATDINQLRIPPANHLERLKGDRDSQYSIRVNDQWRLCFIWEHGRAEKIELVDYH